MNFVRRMVLPLLLCSACSTGYAKTANYLEYTFQKRDSVSLLITLSFIGEKTGVTLLHLPNEWAGQQKLYGAISQLKAISGAASILPTDKPYEYVLKHPANARIKLSYVLGRDWTGNIEYPYYFRPVIEKDFFYFEGYSGLAYPDIDDRTPIRCKIRYCGFSSDFKGNSFFANDSVKSFTTTLGRLANGIYCAGKFRRQQISVKGRNIMVAITGQYAFTDEDAFSLIAKIIFAERKFWVDKGVPYFFTVLIPTVRPGNYGGTAHYNSFSLFQSGNISLSKGPGYLVSHEYFHNWIGQGLRMPAPEDMYKWFSEGFTDYYAFKLLYATGTTSKSEFIDKLNDNIRGYYLSPYFKLENKNLVGKYWQSADYKDLSYRRGLTIAFALDTRIQDKGRGSLDDLLKELYQRSKPGLTFSKPLFDQLVTRYADTAMLTTVDSANNGTNELLTGILGRLMHYRLQMLAINKVFDLGFDYAASAKARKIIGLKAGSNAEKAGLAENMEITNKFSIWNNDTEKPARVEVIKDGKKVWLEYIPATETRLFIPQVSG